MTSKGPGEAQTYDGSTLRIGIIHGRWNTAVTEALVSGTKKALQGPSILTLASGPLPLSLK